MELPAFQFGCNLPDLPPPRTIGEIIGFSRMSFGNESTRNNAGSDTPSMSMRSNNPRSSHIPVVKIDNSGSSRSPSGSKNNEGGVTITIKKEFEMAANSTSPSDVSFNLEMEPFKKLNMNIPQKRTISMLSEEATSSVEDDTTGNLMTCAVCFEEYNCSGHRPLKEPLFLECHHTLCRGCVNKVFQRPPENHKCPLCRARIHKRNCLQKNFYVEAMLKNKRHKSVSDLTVWCLECKAIAKKQCSNHKFQEVSEAVCHLWSTNNDLWKSLTGIIADLSQSCKLSHETSCTAYNEMVSSMTDLIKVVQGLEHMFQKLVHRKRNVSTQMETIQNEIKMVEPYIKKFDSIVAWESGSSGAEGGTSSGISHPNDEVPLTDQQKRLKNVRQLSHENQVNLAKQIRTVINMLNDIEKYSNIAVNNREALNRAITAIDTEQMKKLVNDKLQIVLKSVNKTFEDFDPVLHESSEGFLL